ncbi:2Fe-2S iron-sulfur cluster-binding protein [Enterovibrio nigricans]|uniref:NADH-quinone oxidoreductase subunit G n=1 Tax=Enterovibrio nigricans DSM 22720 TaxID=1121868 RepID=A0A1T4UYX2_9GAMM|nr:2Fe-2S iron-sulfur cluster-binding protein [Enterovibrio nigricans]PKF50079.1 NADP oxidoreductase [Enterovibrio nigricans]SKA57818.1 [NiFe] hydrogenase diaphorase moiety small subunit [Enterovibrio nigricans DSM 22720]
MSITLMIDGKEVTAKENQMLVDVAADNGVYIPTLCYQRGKPCLGTCRVCTCKVNGNNAASCTVPVSEGMVVEVNEPETKDIRKALVEMLFVEGKHNCPSCEKSGRCDLQAVGYETGMMVSRFPYRFPVTETDFRSEKIWLERDRCIFCQRCVEFVKDRETGKKIFSINGRGSTARIEIDVVLADKMSDEQVTEAMELCPVGCILKKAVGFDAPIGRRKFEIQSVRDRATRSDNK